MGRELGRVLSGGRREQEIDLRVSKFGKLMRSRGLCAVSVERTSAGLI